MPHPKTERLQKYMAHCGVASRRESEEIIASGRVTVNGVVAQVGDSVDPEHDTILLDEQELTAEKKVYVLLHKPAGVLSTVTDTHERKTVIDCVQGVDARLVPVGRLDMDVTGVLLLTNDGALTYRLSHPKFEVDKVYRAEVSGVVRQETAERLAAGVELEDGPTAKATVNILSFDTESSVLEITVHEGRNHLVKRMCGVVGHPVLRLTRESIGPLTCKRLKPGEWRYLTHTEVERLKQSVEKS